jgi:adenylylsulfate kinase-like enzyme
MENDRSDSRIGRRDEPSKMECVRKVWTEIRLALMHTEPLHSIHSRLQGSGIPADYHPFATYVNRLRKAEKMRSDKEQLTVSNGGGASPAITNVLAQLPLATPSDTIAQKRDWWREELPSLAMLTGVNAGTDHQPHVFSGTDIHLFLQGTGGIGKSVMASVLAQYLIARGCSLRCVDSDPVNRTFSRYKALGVERIELTDGGVVNKGRLEGLVNTIVNANNKLIVDAGASAFVAIQNHFLKTNLFEKLSEAGKQVYIHTVITAGQAQDDTLERLRQLTDDVVADRNICVWVNEFFGVIDCDGKPFVESTLFQERKGKVVCLISFPRRGADTFGYDVDLMISRGLTFEEAIEGEGPQQIMPKHRLSIVQRDLFEQLDKSPFAMTNATEDKKDVEDRIPA